MQKSDGLEIFISAYAEISKAYVSRFPDQECVQEYLKSVSEKAGAELISHSNDESKDRTFTVKGPWQCVNRAHSILQNFLTTFDEANLRSEEVDETVESGVCKLEERNDAFQSVSNQNDKNRDGISSKPVVLDEHETKNIQDITYKKPPLKQTAKALRNASHSTKNTDKVKSARSKKGRDYPPSHQEKKGGQIHGADNEENNSQTSENEEDIISYDVDDNDPYDVDYTPDADDETSSKTRRQPKGKPSFQKAASRRKTKTKQIKSIKRKVKSVEVKDPVLKSGRSANIKTRDSDVGSNTEPNNKILSREARLRLVDSVNYPCSECPYTAKKKSALREHRRRVHRTKDFTCDKCGKVFGFGKDLTRHKKSHEKPQNCCDICGKLYKGLRTLAEHRKTHDVGYEKPEFQCDMCEKSFSTKYVLAYHIKSDHLGMKRTYLCPTCGKSFSQKHSYLQHANVHLGIRPYKCQLCDKSFAYEKSLREHKFMHDNIRRFKCDLCDKSFRQTSALAIHARIHKKEKDYVCSSCGRGFSQKQALNRHERIHLGEKPFVCGLCNRNFTDASVLRRHMILIHKKEPKKWREDTVSHVKRAQYFIDVVNKNSEREAEERKSVVNRGETNELVIQGNEPQLGSEYGGGQRGIDIPGSSGFESSGTDEKQTISPGNDYLLPASALSLPQNPVSVSHYMNSTYDSGTMFPQQLAPGTFNPQYLCHNVTGSLHTLENVQQPSYYPQNYSLQTTKHYEHDISNQENNSL